VARSREYLAPEALCADVLPDDPDQLFRAAQLLAGEQAPRPLLLRAVALVGARGGQATRDQLVLRAQGLNRLGRAEDAAVAFEQVAARWPGGEWRLEYAQTLLELGRLEDARREVRVLLQQTPDHQRATELHDRIIRQISEGR
jgi:hypothetical protein